MIRCDPEMNFGMPALVGRRLTVYDIVTKVFYEDSVYIALKDYDISYSDAEDAIRYCMSLKCKTDKYLVHFCDGCLLRTISEGDNFNKSDYLEVLKNGKKVTISKDKKVFFSGTIEELENSEFGKVTWLIAEEANLKLRTIS